MMNRQAQSLLALLAIVVVGGIVHIVSMLMLPRLAPHDAFARAAQFLTEAQPQKMPPAEAAENTIPFRDPMVASVICRYDLEQGHLRVAAASSEEALVAVSFHSRFGLAFYGLTDHASHDGKLELVLMTEMQLEKAQGQDTEGEPVRDLRVVSPDAQGFVEFDALPRIGGYAAAEQALRSVSCQIERDF